MTSQYTHKMVDGEVIPLTPEEIAALEARDVQMAQQKNVMASDPGYGQTIKQTLVPLPTQGPF